MADDKGNGKKKGRRGRHGHARRGDGLLVPDHEVKGTDILAAFRVALTALRLASGSTTTTPAGAARRARS